MWNYMINSEKDYRGMFDTFLSNKTKMTSTYKAVFLRSLLDLGNYKIDKKMKHVADDWIKIVNIGGEQKIELDQKFIALRFLKYYWDMEHSFHLKQTSNMADASILQIIKEEIKTKNYKNPPTMDELFENNELLNKVVKSKGTRNVTQYLKTNMRTLYTHDKKRHLLILDVNIIYFLEKNHIFLKTALNHKLAKRLERLNKSIPQIANKLDERSRTKLKNKEILFLKKNSDKLCFYCNCRFDESPHIDHVIPYNYIYATELHNSVLACERCNIIKSDRLPEMNKFKIILDRNDEWQKTLSRNCVDKTLTKDFSTYVKEWYERQYHSCKIDYQGSEDYFKCDQSLQV